MRFIMPALLALLISILYTLVAIYNRQLALIVAIPVVLIILVLIFQSAVQSKRASHD